MDIQNPLQTDAYDETEQYDADNLRIDFLQYPRLDAGKNSPTGQSAVFSKQSYVLSRSFMSPMVKDRTTRTNVGLLLGHPIHRQGEGSIFARDNQPLLTYYRRSEKIHCPRR